MLEMIYVFFTDLEQCVSADIQCAIHRYCWTANFDWVSVLSQWIGLGNCCLTRYIGNNHTYFY